jgi:hypothetical protein
MPVPVSPVLWAGSLSWLSALSVVSFLVTLIAADNLRRWRTSLMKLAGLSSREPCRPERPSGRSGLRGG